MNLRDGRGTAWLAVLVLALAGCGVATPAASQSGLQVHAISASATPVPSPSISPAAATPAATPIPPAPTPTAGPVVFTLDFTIERRDDVTLRVGQAIQLKLTSGPTGDWVSGVDDARVLRPMAPDGNGVYQAVAPGSALVTAHVPFGCANVTPAGPCRNPEHGLWFQTRVYVLA
ncbi:MAG: hypothetical protein ACHQ7M_14120 [Chloroflexota bacterium]